MSSALSTLMRLASGQGVRTFLATCGGSDGCPRQLFVVGATPRKFSAARLAAIEEGWKLGHRTRCPDHNAEVQP